MKIWLYRAILILSPVLGFILLLIFAEISLRIYYAVKGGGRPNYSLQSEFRAPPPEKVAASSQFSLPTHIHQKKLYDVKSVERKNGQLDGKDAYFQFEFLDDVFVLPARAKKNLILRLSSGEEIYNTRVETDQNRRRITPDAPGKSPTKHLIFYGCSYTLGEGVQQNETLPYYTAAATKDYRSYNLGINGGTISDAWVYTYKTNHLNDIPEDTGIAFYTFFDDHIARYKGSIQHIAEWIYTRPLVRPDANGNIQFLGRWMDARPIITGLSIILGRSYLVHLLNFNFPPVQQQDVEDFVKVLKSVRDGYWKKFGKENPFIVVFYYHHSGNYAPILKPLLEREQISYLDYSSVGIEQLSDQPTVMPYDLHPNALAHKITGELIAEDLNLQ